MLSLRPETVASPSLWNSKVVLNSVKTGYCGCVFVALLLRVLIRRVRYEDACVDISAAAHRRTAHEFLYIIYFPDISIWRANLFVLEHNLAWITSCLYTWETLFKQCLLSVFCGLFDAISVQPSAGDSWSSTWVQRGIKQAKQMTRRQKDRLQQLLWRDEWRLLLRIGKLSEKLEGPWKNGVLIFFEMPQLIAMRCPQCMDD